MVVGFEGYAATTLNKLKDKAKELVSAEELKAIQNRKLNEQMLASNKSISHKFAETREILSSLRKNINYVESSSSSEDQLDRDLDRIEKIPS